MIKYLNNLDFKIKTDLSLMNYSIVPKNPNIHIINLEFNGEIIGEVSFNKSNNKDIKYRINLNKYTLLANYFIK